jgi:hypothetical protein
MRQVHVAIVDPATGEIRAAQIFVAALGDELHLRAYACATPTQTAADWVGSLNWGAGVHLAAHPAWSCPTSRVP